MLVNDVFVTLPCTFKEIQFLSVFTVTNETILELCGFSLLVSPGKWP